ncbi:unnamed protein product [marine sediment metagenome]|uniref:Uncharacterized protein n=1 Tax=marine sediment metagenome TaxID=412755 RepID=X1U9T6_9ZZZZ
MKDKRKDKKYSLEQLHSAWGAGKVSGRSSTKIREANYAAALESVLNQIAEEIQMESIDKDVGLRLLMVAKAAFCKGEVVKADTIRIIPNQRVKATGS